MMKTWGCYFSMFFLIGVLAGWLWRRGGGGGGKFHGCLNESLLLENLERSQGFGASVFGGRVLDCLLRYPW